MCMCVCVCVVPAPSCEDPGVPLNGRRIGDNFTVGAVVFFQCFGGFDIVGSRFRVCREGGVYSGAQPTCQPVDGMFVFVYFFLSQLVPFVFFLVCCFVCLLVFLFVFVLLLLYLLSVVFVLK